MIFALPSAGNQTTAWSPDIVAQDERVMGNLVNDLKHALNDMTLKYTDAERRAGVFEYRLKQISQRREVA